MKDKTKDRLILVLGIIVLLFLSISLIINTSKENNVICYNFKSLNETLNKINDNCGSTFITKEYDSNNWSVFKNNCNSEGYCKNIYIDLDNCLKEEMGVK